RTPRSGRARSTRATPEGPSWATSTRNPSLRRRAATAEAIDSSSSMTATVRSTRSRIRNQGVGVPGAMWRFLEDRRPIPAEGGRRARPASGGAGRRPGPSSSGALLPGPRRINPSSAGFSFGAGSGLAMTSFGYTLMTEQHGPKELVANAVAAEQAGFDF